jgi:hypothetical protein
MLSLEGGGFFSGFRFLVALPLVRWAGMTEQFPRVGVAGQTSEVF